MSKRLGILFLCLLFATFMVGCFGGDDSTTTTTTTATDTIELNGTLPTLTASGVVGGPAQAVAFGTTGKYTVGAYSVDITTGTETELTSATVLVTGTTFKVTMGRGTTAVNVVVIVKEKTTGRTIYKNLVGAVPTTTAVKGAVKINSIPVNAETTARTIMAVERKVTVPTVTTSTTAVEFANTTVVSTLNTTLGTTNITNLATAVTAVVNVLVSTVSDATKAAIMNNVTTVTTATQILTAFVNAVKSTDATVSSTVAAVVPTKTVTVEGTTFNSSSTTTTLPPPVTPTKTLSSIAVSPATLSINASASQTLSLTVTATYSDATTAAVTGYTLSAASGTLSGTSYTAPATAGSTTITVTYVEGGVTKTATIAVTVNAVTPTKTLSSIAVNPATLTAQVGTTATMSSLVVTATYSDATTAAVTSYTASTNFNVSTKVYTAPATGTTDTITITYVEGGVTKTADIAVTLTSTAVKTLSSIAVTPATLTVVNGATQAVTLVVTATYSDATTATVTGATADKLTNGVYTAPATGTTDTITVTYTENAVTKTATIAVTLSAVEVVATPTFTPAAGTYTSTQSVVLATTTSGATIYYTTDGSTPTTASTVYSAAISVATTTTIKAIAAKTGMTTSAVAEAAYTVNIPAPSVVTTVEVTLASSIEETTTTAAVVVVKDQFGVAMTTGFTTTYAITTGTSTVSSLGVVTGGSYSSTAANNNHVLTVTVTPTTGTALTKTAAFTVTADATKPTMVSVQAIDNKTIVVTYSEKVGTSATTVTNYSLYHSTTGVTAPLNTAAAANKIYATALFTDSTQKVVKISLVTVDTAFSGYPAGGLDAVNYRLYASNIQDTSSNANTIISNSNVQFLGTTTPDSNKPVINAIAYNKGTGNLVITLDKAVTNAITYSNIKFNTTTLTAAVTINAQPAANKLDITLASADKTTVAAMTGDISVTIAADAIADSNSNKNIATTLTATITVPPTMTSASYDEASNTLTMGFSQTLDLSTATLRDAFKTGTNIQLKSTEMAIFALDANDSVTTSSNANTVSVLLSNTNAAKIENVSSHTNAKVVIAASVFKNTNGDYNLKADDSSTDYPAVTLSITKDSTKPAIQSITYSESTKKLIFTFNVPVSRTFTGANVTFFTDKDDSALAKDLSGLTATEVTDGTTLTFDLTTTDPNGLKTAFKAVQQGSTTALTPETYNVYAKVTADTFTKVGSTLKNVAVTAKATATTMTYTDNMGPYINGAVTVTNKVTLSIAFDEKVNKTDAETAANYKVYLMSGSTKVSQLTVNSVSMTDYTTFGRKTVQIVTATQTDNASYLLEVANVKDVTGNAISTTDASLYSKSFTGSTTAAPAPKPVSAKIKDNGNQSLDTSDYIAVTFDRPVKLNTSAASTQVIGNKTGANISNFVLVTGNFPADYSKTNNLMMSTDTADLDKVVWIKVDSAMVSGGASPITVGTSTINYGNLGTETLVQDKYSDVYATAAAGAVTIESALGATTISSATLVDTDASGTINKGDKLTIVFSNPLYVVSGQTLDATDIVLAVGTLGTSPTVTTTMTTSVASNTIEVTVDTGATLTPVNVKAGDNLNIAAGQLRDSWNINLPNTTVKAVSTATVVAPYITKAEWVDVDASGTGNLNDYVYVTFNVPVYLNNANTAAMWKAAGTVLGNAPTVTKVQSNNSQLRVQLGGNVTLTPTVTTWEIDPAVVLSNITNYSGDPAVVATTINKIAVASDTTAPTITSVEFISENKAKIVFSEAVNVSNYKTTDGSAGLNVNGDAAREFNAVALDSTDTTGKTAIFTNEANFSIAEQSNGITAGLTTGLKIVTANAITDIAGNALVATQAGSNYIAISKDTTAPDATVLAYELATKKNQLLFNFLGAKVTENNTNAIAYGELALLQVYTGSATPAADATPNGIQASYTSTAAQNTDIVTGITGAVAGQKVFYRLIDRAGNKSAWLEKTTLAGLPAGTYKKVAAASPTTATEANLSGNTLSVGTGSATVQYDVAANATVKSIMTNVAVNDTFVIASDKVTTLTTTNLAGGATVVITAADCAASINVSSHATNTLTLQGSAASQATNFNITAGSVDVSNANLTGTNTVTATAAATVAAGNKAVSVAALSNASTITTTGALTTSADITGTLTLAGPPSGITADGSVTISGSVAHAITNVATGKTLTISGTPTNVTVTTTTGTGKVALLGAASGNLVANGGIVEVGNGTSTAGSVAGTTTVAGATTLVTVKGTGGVGTLTGAVTLTNGTLDASAAGALTGGVVATVTDGTLKAGANVSWTQVTVQDGTGAKTIELGKVIPFNITAVTTAGRTVGIKAMTAIAANVSVTQLTNGTATATADVPNPAAAVGNGIATWNIGSSAAAGATTRYTVNNGTAVIDLNPIASGVTVTLTKN